MDCRTADICIFYLIESKPFSIVELSISKHYFM